MARNNDKSALHQCLDHMPEYLSNAGFQGNTAVLQDSVELVKIWCLNRKLVRCKEAVVAAAISVACIKNHIHCVSRELARKLNADVAQVNRFIKKLKVLSNISEDPMYYASMARAYATEAANNLNMDDQIALVVVNATTDLVLAVISDMKARELKSVVAACFFSCAYENGRPVMKKEICAALTIAEPTVTAACRQLEVARFKKKQSDFFMGFNDFEGLSGYSGENSVCGYSEAQSCFSGAGTYSALPSADPSCFSGGADSVYSGQHTVNEVPAAHYDDIIKHDIEHPSMVDDMLDALASSDPTLAFGYGNNLGNFSSVQTGGGKMELGDSAAAYNDAWDYVQAARV